MSATRWITRPDAQGAAIVNYNPQYKPGDVANGHVLTQDGQWVPLSVAPAHNQKKGMGTGAKVLLIGAASLGLIGSCSVMAALASGDKPAQSVSLTSEDDWRPTRPPTHPSPMRHRRPSLRPLRHQRPSPRT